MNLARRYKITIFFVGILFFGTTVGFSLKIALGVFGFLALSIIFYFFTEPAFLILVAYLPFQLALNVSPGIDLLSGRVLILILSAVCLLKTIKEKKFFWPKDKTALALILFFLLAALSALVAQNQIWALRKLLVFASVFPLFFLAKFLINKTPRLKNFCWVIVLAAGFSSLLALWQFISQFVFGAEAVVGFWAKNIIPLFLGNTFGQTVLQNPSWFVEISGRPLMRAIGLFPDPHMLSFFLGMTLPVALALFFWDKNKKKLLFVVCCLILTTLALTFSRGGYLGALGGILAVVIILWRRLGVRAKMFVFSFFMVLAALVFTTPVFGRFFSSFDLSEGSNLGRLAIWSQSLTVSKSNVFLGVGLGNYPLALNFGEDYRSAVTSHNLYLDILAELGIFGLVCWLWFYLGLLKNSLIQAKLKSGFVCALAAGFFGAFIYFAIHSFFETALFNPTILAWLMLFGGLASGLKNYTPQETDPKKL